MFVRRCFRCQLLLARSHPHLTQALMPALMQTGTSETKLGRNVLLHGREVKKLSRAANDCDGVSCRGRRKRSVRLLTGSRRSRMLPI